MSAGAEYEPVLPLLIGYELSSVVFIRDYCQLGLETYRSSSTVSCFVWPYVETSTTTLKFESGGYRDALCSLINQRVIAATEARGEGLRLRFDSGIDVVLNPTIEELVAVEIATVQGLPRNQWMAWRPGDRPFEHLG